MIERAVFDWGVRLRVRPLDQASLDIKAEIENYRPGKGAVVRVWFPGTSVMDALRLVEAQAWNEGLAAIIDEIRVVVAGMKGQKSSSRAGR